MSLIIAYAGEISKGSLRVDISAGDEQPEDHRESLEEIREAIETDLAIAMSLPADDVVKDGSQRDAIRTEATELIDGLISLCDTESGIAQTFKNEPSHGQKRSPRDSPGDRDTSGAEPPQTTNKSATVGSSGSSSSKRGRVR